MLRLVLAVALAASLVAAATPAVEDARTTRTERLTERELGRVATATNYLISEEEPGARRTLRVSFPGESPTTASLAFVALGGLPDGKSAADTVGNDVLAYRVAGGRRDELRVEADLRVHRDDDSVAGGSVTGDSVTGDSVAGDSRALVLRGGTTYRLTLRLVRLDGRPTVIVASREI